MSQRILVSGIVAGEFAVILMLAANAWLQLDREEDRIVRQTQLGGVTIAREAREHFLRHPEERTRRGRRTFAASLLADGAIPLPAFANESGYQLEVDLMDDEGAITSERWNRIRDPSLSVIRDGRQLIVRIPFQDPGVDLYGHLWIQHDRLRIARSSILDPPMLFFQLVAFTVLSIVVVLTMTVLARRERVTVFERGYLKEHAIGALKIQHRLLGQIIREHEEDDRREPEGLDDEDEEPVGEVRAGRSAKVIPMPTRRDPGDDR